MTCFKVLMQKVKYNGLTSICQKGSEVTNNLDLDQASMVVFPDTIHIGTLIPTHLFICWLGVTYLERADRLALVCDVYCVLLLSYVVSWVRCGT